MAQARPVLVGEHRPDDVDDSRAERQPQPAHSRITVAMATPRSSVRVTWALEIFLWESNFFKASEYSRTGLPEGRFLTQTPCQLAGAWIPVPSALVNASFAAKRLAR